MNNIIMNQYNEEAKIIRDHIMNSCNKASINNEPYPHMIIDNFFPSDIVRKIDNLFPDINHYTFDLVTETESQKRYRRSFFIDDPSKPALEQVLDCVYDNELLKYFLNRFNVPYDENYAWGIHYACDYSVEGCQALPPHVDIKSKILSFVYYVPLLSIINGKPEVQKIPGTDILIRNDDGTFTEHTCVEAKRNRCFVFEKSTKSWHAVKETKSLRRTITAFIIDKRLNEEVRIPFMYVK